MEFSWPLQVAQRLINLSTSVLQNCKTLSNAQGSPASMVCFTNCNSPSLVFVLSISGSSRNKFMESSYSLTCCDICDYFNNFAVRSDFSLQKQRENSVEGCVGYLFFPETTTSEGWIHQSRRTPANTKLVQKITYYINCDLSGILESSWS